MYKLWLSTQTLVQQPTYKPLCAGGGGGEHRDYRNFFYYIQGLAGRDYASKVSNLQFVP